MLDIPEGMRWKSEHFLWDPQLQFFNLRKETLEARELEYHITAEEPEGDNTKAFTRHADSLDHKGAREAVAQGKTLWVHQRVRRLAEFEEILELRAFPIDLQMLHLTLTSQWSHTQVVLKFTNKSPSTVSDSACNSQVFTLSEPRLLSFEPWTYDGWQPGDLPLLSLPEESRTGARYCRMHFVVILSRDSTYYVLNILTMQALLCPHQRPDPAGKGACPAQTLERMVEACVLACVPLPCSFSLRSPISVCT
jgi:hypothetical protein